MVTETDNEVTVMLRNTRRHQHQRDMVNSTAKRLIVRAGRRGGKTVGFAIRAVKRFLEGRRQLYAAPTGEQTDTFWYEVSRALEEPIRKGLFKLNETERFIEKPGTKQRIKAKTAWNANTLRGDYADDLYLDEFQLMAEDTWNEVGAPMLLDNNGDAVFIYTPPSLHATGVSKARDPRHASKMFRKALEDTTGLWQAMHFTSLDNPFISREGLALITGDMSLDSYRREIMAEDDEIELSWLVYGAFDEELCKIKRFEIPKEWPVWSGHDFGKANPAALFIAQVRLPLPMGAPRHMRYGDYVVYREYLPGGGLSTARHADYFINETKENRFEYAVGGNQTTEDEIRQGYSAHLWPIRAPQITRVNAQIDRVKGLLESKRLHVFSDLMYLLTEFSNCMWKLDKDGQRTDDIDNEQRYHLLAALRYIGSEFRPGTVIEQKPLSRRLYRI